MRILALVEGENHVCYRYRLDALRNDFAAHDLQLESLPLARGVFPFFQQLAAISRADVVVLQRRLLAGWKLKLLRHAARRLVFDIDDAVFFRDSNSPRSTQCASRWRRFQCTVQTVDLVTAGNAFLVAQAEKCLSATSRQKVMYVPTVVDPSRYSLASHTPSAAQAKLVWIGSRSTMASLDDAQPALSTAAAQLGTLNLKVICDAFPQIAGVNVIACPWSEASEASEIAACDVGISWLPDHPWSEGKCGLKALQYMAAGLPVVANPTALHPTLIVDGVTGYLASTPEEWSTAIARLVSSPDLRRAIGRAARLFVERNYSTTVWGPRLAAHYLSLVRGKVGQAA